MRISGWKISEDYSQTKGIYHDELVFQGSFTAQSGYDLMKEAIQNLGDQLPPAFFAASDSLAIGALRALQEAGISLPDRVSLISFNDTSLTKQVYPPSLASPSIPKKWAEQVWIFLIRKFSTVGKILA